MEVPKTGCLFSKGLAEEVTEKDEKVPTEQKKEGTPRRGKSVSKAPGCLLLHGTFRP